MQINAINPINSLNSVNSVNFGGKKENVPANRPAPISNGFMNKVKGPLMAIMFIPAAAVTSCDNDIDISASASASAVVVTDDSNNNNNCDNDTTAVNPSDTTAVEFPYAIPDSLYTWINDYLNIPIDGGNNGGSDGVDSDGVDNDGNGGNGGKNLSYLYGERDWFYKQPESLSLNLEKSKGQTDAAYYDYVLDDASSDLKITNVAAGDLTIVKKDGTETDNITGLLMSKDEDAAVFMHSNGKDRIYVYTKETSGENKGKFVELGYAEHGYLYNSDGTEMERYGQNIALYDILAEGTEDHYINVVGEALSNEEIQEKLKEE